MYYRIKGWILVTTNIFNLLPTTARISHYLWWKNENQFFSAKRSLNSSFSFDILVKRFCLKVQETHSQVAKTPGIPRASPGPNFSGFQKNLSEAPSVPPSQVSWGGLRGKESRREGEQDGEGFPFRSCEEDGSSSCSTAPSFPPRCEHAGVRAAESECVPIVGLEMSEGRWSCCVTCSHHGIQNLTHVLLLFRSSHWEAQRSVGFQAELCPRSYGHLMLFVFLITVKMVRELWFLLKDL